MPGLQGRDKGRPVALMVLIGLAVLVTKAEAVTIERPSDVATTIPATPPYPGITAMSGLIADAERPVAVLNTGQDPLISRRLLDAAWAAAVPQATGSHIGSHI